MREINFIDVLENYELFSEQIFLEKYTMSQGYITQLLTNGLHCVPQNNKETNNQQSQVATGKPVGYKPAW